MSKCQKKKAGVDRRPLFRLNTVNYPFGIARPSSPPTTGTFGTEETLLRGIACPTEQHSFGHYPWCLPDTLLNHETVLCGSGLTYNYQPTSSITDGSATITLLRNTPPSVMQGYAINPNQLHYAPSYDLSGSGSGFSAPGLAFSQPFMHVPTPSQYSMECTQDEIGATTLGQNDSTTQR